MKTAVAGVVISWIAGIVASIVWFALIIVASGESQPAAVYVLYSSGILFAAGSGAILGRLRDLALPHICLGWLLTIPFTPAFASLRNTQAPNPADDRWFLFLILVLYFAAGAGCTYLATRSRHRAEN